MSGKVPVDPDSAVIVALGGNLPGAHDSVESLLEAALAAIEDEGLRVVSRSSWWRSAAWPNPSDPSYLNGVILVSADLAAHDLLAALHRIERAFGRERHLANAPRTLDLDLIAYGRQVIDEPGLHLPHRRAHERRFVMGPLAEMVPGWRHPTLGETAEILAESAKIGMDATPVG